MGIEPNSLARLTSILTIGPQTRLNYGSSLYSYPIYYLDFFSGLAGFEPAPPLSA
ncbi:MAG: hypothetical protein ACFFAO_16510 [Candidatus Hermodarchaeota archaeon]